MIINTISNISTEKFSFSSNPQQTIVLAALTALVFASLAWTARAQQIDWGLCSARLNRKADAVWAKVAQLAEHTMAYDLSDELIQKYGANARSIFLGWSDQEWKNALNEVYDVPGMTFDMAAARVSDYFPSRTPASWGETLRKNLTRLNWRSLKGLAERSEREVARLLEEQLPEVRAVLMFRMEELVDVVDQLEGNLA